MLFPNIQNSQIKLNCILITLALQRLTWRFFVVSLDLCISRQMKQLLYRMNTVQKLMELIN